LDIDAAVFGIESAVSGLAGGGDAVESVDAELGADEKVAWLGAHAEPVARLGVGEELIDEFEQGLVV